MQVLCCVSTFSVKPNQIFSISFFRRGRHQFDRDSAGNIPLSGQRISDFRHQGPSVFVLVRYLEFGVVY